MSRSSQNTSGAEVRGAGFGQRGISTLYPPHRASSIEDRMVAIPHRLGADPMTSSWRGSCSAHTTATGPGVQLASLNRTRAGESARVTKLTWPSVDVRPPHSSDGDAGGRPPGPLNTQARGLEGPVLHAQNLVVRGGCVRVRSYAAWTSSPETPSTTANAPAEPSDSGRCPRSSAASVEVGMPAAAASSGCVNPARIRKSDSNASDRSIATTAETGAPSTLSTATSLSIWGEDDEASQYRMAFSLTPATLPSSPGLRPRDRRSSDRACGSKPLITFRLNRRTSSCVDRSRRSILAARFLGVTLRNYIQVCYFEVAKRRVFRHMS